MAVIGASVVWLPVDDLDRALTFYGERLQLKIEHRDEDWAQLDANGLRLGLNASESPSGQGGAVIAFQPQEALEETIERLRSDGIEFAGQISEHPWGRVASFKDPDGNDLQLYEPPADG